MLAAGLAEIAQVMGDLAIAIDAPALQPGVLDQAEQALILPVA